MGNKSFVAVILSFVGGALVGYGYGVKVVINSILAPIPEITATVVGSMTLGIGTSVGRSIGNSLVSEMWDVAMGLYGNINQIMFVGGILAVLGIVIGMYIEEKDIDLKI